jgi:hypothetical protein
LYQVPPHIKASDDSHKSRLAAGAAAATAGGGQQQQDISFGDIEDDDEDAVLDLDNFPA